MQNIKNFKLTKPVTPEQKAIAEQGPAAFLISEDGRDWYTSQKDFKADTLKFAYNAQGVITAISHDVSGLWPVDMSVAETDSAPEGVNNRGLWVYDGAHVFERELTASEREQMAAHTLSSRMRDAEAIIAPLSRAEKYGQATDTELARLTAWEKYTVLLSRIDVSQAPNITWPEEPQ
ncbi:MAG: tail fiber assembly protein [Rouxiella aceris]|uniref:tail fiber assembly protein n=1 Tax=Rouxiella aceris TaxID=2703884 RepID=UPI00283E370C|nr:tail fiber assembly protein [Rouxiella aceris]MDR3432550.1 tail fiber assembly protein [Rouxiella aceris]